jgi:two-component system, sensor histidine kinase
VPAAVVLDAVRAEFAAVATQRGLKFVVRPSRLAVRSDAMLLKRIVGNLIANALRYTEHGGVLIGCRRRGATVLF